jgi:hypothetical protein
MVEIVLAVLTVEYKYVLEQSESNAMSSKIISLFYVILLASSYCDFKILKCVGLFSIASLIGEILYYTSLRYDFFLPRRRANNHEILALTKRTFRNVTNHM